MPKIAPTEKPIQVFCSYSHQDEGFRRELEKHLVGLRRNGLIADWYDRKIGAGEDWEEQILDNLDRSSIILALVSVDFLSSNYCSEIELKIALKMQAEGEAIVIPIILRECAWEETPLGKLQALPTGGKPVDQWPSKDAGFTDIYKGIEAVVKKLRARAMPALSTRRERFNNLPTPATPFIGGRERVVGEAERELRGESRLVVLHGYGGSGKTRVALEVARDLAGEFEHGVGFVELDIVSDPDLVASRIARTLGIRETDDVAVATALKQYLESKQMLLVLDNFEHLGPAAGFLTDLLAACPRLRVILTSRRLLRIRGGRNIEVPFLNAPRMPPPPFPPPDGLSQFDAVKLFIQAARTVARDFCVTNENAPAVAEICARLEGLALAVELAAAQINRFGGDPREMLQTLTSTLPEARPEEPPGRRRGTLDGLLGHGPEDVPGRLRTMSATIAWSYDLLGPDQQRLFRRLSVFRGGCTAQAAEWVCNEGGDLRIGVRDALESLVEHNLLRGEGSAERRRYRMLDIIREYGLRRLEEDREADAVRSRHAEYYLALAEDAETHLTSAGRGDWLSRLEDEHANLLSALEWGRAHGAAGDLGPRLAGALFWFWNLSSRFSEGRAWLAGVLSTYTGPERTAGYARALYASGGLAFLQNDYEAARPFLEHSAAIWRALGDDPRRLGLTLVVLGMTALSFNDFPTAEGCEEDSLAIFRGLGDRWCLALALNDRGNVHRLKEEYPEAIKIYRRSLAIWREMSDTWGQPLTLSNLGFVFMMTGDFATAARHLKQALAIQDQVGDRWGQAETLKYMADLAIRQERYTDAEVLYRKSLTLNREIGRKQFLVACLAGLASVAARRGQVERAATLSGAVERLLGEFRVPARALDHGIYGPTMAELRAQFQNKARHSRLRSRGRAMTLDEAVEGALASTA